MVHINFLYVLEVFFGLNIFIYKQKNHGKTTNQRKYRDIHNAHKPRVKREIKQTGPEKQIWRFRIFRNQVPD